MSRSKEIKKDLQDVLAINVIAKMDGGKIIIASLVKDILNSVDKLANNYNDSSHAELMGHCASLRANLGLLRVFKNAPSNKAIIENELRLALEEEGEVEVTES